MPPSPNNPHSASNAPMTGASGQHGPRHVAFERERGVYDVLVTPNLAHAVVKVGGDDQRAEHVRFVFRTMADQDIPIFLIKLHRNAVTFGIESGEVPRLEACMSEFGLETTVRTGLALITVVASSMRDLAGVMVNIADSLLRAEARLYGVGDSHNSVQCLIDGSRTDEAVRELRATFRLSNGETGAAR
jgi:aspartokinase